jgi:hypothetical protein
MFLFYVDESGNLDCEVKGTKKDGTPFDKDPIYVLTAVSLFDGRWRRFESALSGKKRELAKRIEARGGARFDLADCEVKSSWIRQPGLRQKQPFLAALYDPELQELVDVFYEQLAAHNMQVFSVIVDKRTLHGHMDQAKLHRKAWELLLERVESFLESEHQKHLGILVTDDVSLQMNRSLAMKHAYLLDQGTSASKRLRHIIEMPHFVRSELSNGVQLADLVSYNIYRAFRGPDLVHGPDLTYEWFRRIVPFVWWSTGGPGREGLKVFPPDTPLFEELKMLRREMTPSRVNRRR